MKVMLVALCLAVSLTGCLDDHSGGAAHDTEPSVSGETVTARHDSNQGFLSIELVSDLPAGISAPCFALRVTRGDGAVVWSKTGLCTSVYGGTPPTTLSYVGPCDSASSDHEVTIWIEDVRFDADTPASERAFTNPCPTPSDGDIATWSGGCVVPAWCIKSVDVVVEIAFDMAAARE